MRWPEAREDFAAALNDPARAAPAALVDPAAGRFDVYRNNVMTALIEALAARYPATLRLVGHDFFRVLARAYAQARKPASPVMSSYGADFAAFVATFPPAADMAWLADVAALESVQTEAYHSAEARALTRADLDAARDHIGDSRLALHPSLRLLRAKTPVVTIWSSLQRDGEPAPPPHWRGEDALILRPEADVETRLAPAGGYAFIAALRDGATPRGAAAAALRECGDFNAVAALIDLFDAGAVVGIHPPEERES